MQRLTSRLGTGIITLVVVTGGVDCAQTAGEAIVYEASAGAALASQPGATDVRRFTTAAGYAIELTEARVLIGPAYFYGGGQRASLFDLRPSVAFAHPSDDTFDRGPVLGDVLDQYVVDLLAGPTELGIVPGIKGTIQTLELELQPPGYTALASTATELETMNGHTFVLEGVAEKDGVQYPFRAEGDLVGEAAQRVVDSIESSVDVADREDRSGFMHVDVYLDEWLRFVEFAEVEEEDDQGRKRFSEESNAGVALRRGIRSRFAFGARWRTP